MTEKQFIETYCCLCGTQRCEGPGSEWFEGCQKRWNLDGIDAAAEIKKLNDKVMELATKLLNYEPVIHAYWDTVESERFWICNMEESLKTGKPTKVKLPVCSHCKTEFGTIAFDFKHCPSCGAKMDGGKK